MAIIRIGDKLKTPPTRPSLLLDFANSKVLHPEISFNRSSSATYVDIDGLVKTATDNIPRFTHDPETGECRGIWIEDSETNTIPYSKSTTGWATEKLSQHSTTTETLDPSGGTGALKVREDTNDGPHRVYVNDVAVNSSQYAWWSVWVKNLSTNDTDHRITLESWYSGFSVRQAVFNLHTGEIDSITSAERGFIEKYPNGWYRIGMLIGIQATSVRNFYIFSSRSSDRDPVGETDHGFYWWGAQVESMAFGGAYDTTMPSSFISTSGGSATRSPDVMGLSTVENYLPKMSDSQGPEFSMFANVSIRTASGAARVWQLTGSGARFYDVYVTSGTGYPYGMYSGNSSTTGLVNSNANGYDKVATRFKSGDNTLYVNGLESADNNQVLDSYGFTDLYIGRNNSGQYMGGWLKKLAIYNTPLTDAQLIELSEI